KHHTERGGNAKAVKDQIVCRRLNTAVSQPRAIREHVRLVKWERRDNRKRETDHEPQRRAAKKREQRHAAGRVNFGNGNFVFVDVHSNGFAFGFVFFGAGALNFCSRAIKTARACAGFCHSLAVICIAVSIGKRTMPRDWSTQAGYSKAALSVWRISASDLEMVASRSASIAGTEMENFVIVMSARKITNTMTN